MTDDVDGHEASDETIEAEQMELLARRVDVLEQTVEAQNEMIDRALRLVVALGDVRLDGESALDGERDLEHGEDASEALLDAVGEDTSDADRDTETRGYY